jgi:hypothetical protein
MTWLQDTSMTELIRSLPARSQPDTLAKAYLQLYLEDFKMSHQSTNKLVSKTNSTLKWQLTALSGILSTGLIIILESWLLHTFLDLLLLCNKAPHKRGFFSRVWMSDIAALLTSRWSWGTASPGRFPDLHRRIPEQLSRMTGVTHIPEVQNFWLQVRKVLEVVI